MLDRSTYYKYDIIPTSKSNNVKLKKLYTGS